MFERLKGAIKTESTRPCKWPKDHGQRVKFSRSAEELENRDWKRILPTLSIGPVEHHAPVADCREYVLFEVILPNGTV
jgi:hypothetical protein